MQPHNYKEHFRRNISLAFPVMLSQLGHVLVGVADSVMVGQLGTVPLAAVSLAGSIFHLLMFFGIGVSYSLTPLVAAADGENDASKSIAFLKHGFVVNTFIGLILAAMMYWSSGLLYHLDQEADVVTMAIPFLSIISWSVIPLMMFQSFRQFAEGLSFTKQSMYISLSGNIVNVVLNYVLIFGHWGFSEMGMNGAALATLISRVIMTVSIGAFVLYSPLFSTYWKKFNLKGFSFKIAEQLLKIGIPTGLQFIFEIGAFSMAAIMMGWLGAEQLAAHQIAINVVAITYMMATGISAAATIRVGNQLGRKDIPTLRMAGNTCFLMVAVFMATCGIVLISLNEYLPTLYIHDKVVIDYASTLLMIAAFFQISDGVQVVGLGALRGLGDVRMPTIYTLIAYWIMALPIGYFLGIQLEFGVIGIWMGLLVGLSISAIMQFWRFRRLTLILLNNSKGEVQ
ncbi:MAG: MATE family efflux transporter [Bacteroidetes bacterium]|nr:MATE family efflux transporter [Bacteroidota bacterium]MDA1119919.1 MATE family efflux transporter [Bacteroidota bacterium]